MENCQIVVDSTSLEESLGYGLKTPLKAGDDALCVEFALTYHGPLAMSREVLIPWERFRKMRECTNADCSECNRRFNASLFSA